MIVLVILGIVAAITIPALVRRHVESSNRTRIRKAMAVYDTAINKMVVENGIKSNDALINEFNADKNNNSCAKSRAYFKVSKEGANDCTFRASDGVWWNISDINHPIVAFNEDDLTDEIASGDTNKAFKLVGYLDNNGSLRVGDLVVAEGDNQEYLTKLYNFVNPTTESKIDCEYGDIRCIIASSGPSISGIPICKEERKSCINLNQYGNWDIYTETGGWLGSLQIQTNPVTGEQYKHREYFFGTNPSHDTYWSVNPNTGEYYMSYDANTKEDGTKYLYEWGLDSNGKIYKSRNEESYTDGSAKTDYWYKNPKTGELYHSYEYNKNVDGSSTTNSWAVNNKNGEVYKSQETVHNADSSETSVYWNINSKTGELFQSGISNKNADGTSTSTSWAANPITGELYKSGDREKNSDGVQITNGWQYDYSSNKVYKYYNLTEANKKYCYTYYNVDGSIKSTDGTGCT